MSDFNDDRIKALRTSPFFEPVEGSPGYWIDLVNGDKFHWTQFHLEQGFEHHLAELDGTKSEQRGPTVKPGLKKWDF